MTTRKPPYSNRISNTVLWLCIIGLVISLASCAGVKKDCQGNKHYKQKGGFYI